MCWSDCRPIRRTGSPSCCPTPGSWPSGTLDARSRPEGSRSVGPGRHPSRSIFCRVPKTPAVCIGSTAASNQCERRLRDGYGAVTIQATEAGQVVHGVGPVVQPSEWTLSCVPPERYTTGTRPCNTIESPGRCPDRELWGQIALSRTRGGQDDVGRSNRCTRRRRGSAGNHG